MRAAHTEPDAHGMTIDQARTLLIDHLPVLDEIVRQTAFRRRLPACEAEELAAEVRLRLVDDDFGRVRAFRGECSFRGFLTVVVQRAYIDFRRTRMGKWRPSAGARRAGPDAEALERMINRDGRSLDEAIEARVARDPSLTRQGLRDLAAGLPRRRRPRIVSDESLHRRPADDGDADVLVLESERDRARSRVERALASALDRLAPQDRLILQLRFGRSRTVASIARQLGLEQRPLYRRLGRCLTRVRTSLTEAGVTPEMVEEVLEAP